MPLADWINDNLSPDSPYALCSMLLAPSAFPPFSFVSFHIIAYSNKFSLLSSLGKQAIKGSILTFFRLYNKVTTHKRLVLLQGFVILHTKI